MSLWSRELLWKRKRHAQERAVPDRSGLVERRDNIKGGSRRDRARDSLKGIAVMENGRCGEDPSGESGGDNNVVILRRLVGCEQHRVGLAKVDVEGGVCVLKGVWPFDFHQFQLVSLDSEVDRCCQPHVWYPQSVSLTCTWRCRSHDATTVRNKQSKLSVWLFTDYNF